MYTYASQASLGDDVYGEASTAALEAHVAKITGKEAALFVPSGTMSNQLALRTHLKQPPYSVLCDHRAHIHKYVHLTQTYGSLTNLVTDTRLVERRSTLVQLLFWSHLLMVRVL